MFDKLAAPFREDEIHWRAQNITRDGDKALALAYVDARDVMDRLDAVVGPENWQDAYTETARGRVLCTLSIRIGDQWVSKSDGAGDTAVEGEKGGVSDAFKRAAVKWGIARYLYALGDVWVPCETWKGQDGKPRWKRWTANPWDFVRNKPSPPKTPASSLDDDIKKIRGIWDPDELASFYRVSKEINATRAAHPDFVRACQEQKAAIMAKAKDAAA